MHGSKWLFLCNTNNLGTSVWVQGRLINSWGYLCNLRWQKGVLCPPLAHSSSGWKRLLHCGREQTVLDQIVNQSFSKSTVHLLAAVIWMGHDAHRLICLQTWSPDEGASQEKKGVTADCGLLSMDLQVSWPRPTSSPPCFLSVDAMWLTTSCLPLLNGL